MFIIFQTTNFFTSTKPSSLLFTLGIPEISITDFSGLNNSLSSSNIHFHGPRHMLPVPSANDMDSGVSSGYTSASGEYSLPFVISLSRRSSINSGGYESSMIDTRNSSTPYFRQISFDDAWEENIYQYSKKFNNHGVSFEEDSKRTINARPQVQKRRNARVGFKSLKRMKILPGRRKSVSTRSKAT